MQATTVEVHERGRTAVYTLGTLRRSRSRGTEVECLRGGLVVRLAPCPSGAIPQSGARFRTSGAIFTWS